MNLAIDLGRDDGDPRREQAEDIAKLLRMESCRSHRRASLCERVGQRPAAMKASSRPSRTKARTRSACS